MEGSNRRCSGVAAGNSAHLPNEQQLQAFFGLTEERLKKLRDVVLEKAPELMGDIFGFWAKWACYCLTLLFPNETFQLVIACIFAQICNLPHLLFGLSEERLQEWKDLALERRSEQMGGMSGPQTFLSAYIFSRRPAESPLQIVASFLSTESEELLRDADMKANLQAGAQAVCYVTMLMLVMWMLDPGWKMRVALHCICISAARANLPSSKKALELVFWLVIHIFLSCLGAEASSFLGHSLRHVMGSVFAIVFFYGREIRPVIAVTIFSFGSVICFYTPLWVGVCVATAIFVRIVTDSRASFPDAWDLNDIVQCLLCIFGGLCVVYLVVWLESAGGGLCGALLVFLSPILLLCYYGSKQDVQARMVKPLPFVCASIFCLYTPVWCRLCLTLILGCMLIAVAADDNGGARATLWWFAALHLVCCAFSPNFAGVAMCFLGSYFSYGCML